ncbi:MAG TPA: efflux transporter outer membrane subunit [Stellaceae bacterium]|nr:efflux transporter outer membrane subunit [Stellaceae bacterium]
MSVGIILAGCTVGPDFKTPAPPPVEGYTETPVAPVTASASGPGGAAQHLNEGADIIDDWWQLYRSPDLDAAVTQAIAGSPNLAAARATLRQAHEAVNAAAGAFYPQIDANAGLSRQRASFVPFGENLSIPDFTLYTIGGAVSYPLDIFGGNKRLYEEEKALESVQEQELHAAQLTLTGDTVTEAITIAEASEELNAVNDIIKSDEDNIRLLNTAITAGELAKEGPEILAALSQLASDRNLAPPLLQQRDAARHALTALLGKLPAQWAPPDFDFTKLQLPTELPVALPSTLVAHRPDILVAEARLHAASAAVGVASARLLPNFSLSGALSFNSLTPEKLFDPIGLIYNFGAQVATPLFAGGTLTAQKREAVAFLEASDAQYQQVVVDSFRQVADVLRALGHDADLTEGQQRALEAAQRSLASARAGLRAGAVGYLQVLDATRQYQQARIGYVRAAAQRYRDTAQLFVAMGAGWWHT